MKSNSSAIVYSSQVLSQRAPRRAGLWWGLLGVVAFSFTLPFTRIAVEGLPPLFVGAGRAVVAAMLAATALAFTRQTLPRGRQWWRLAVVGLGVVAGFPLLTSVALATVPASHGAVVIGVLPAATAVVTVLRTGERPSRGFWICSGLGALAAIGFAGVQGGVGALGGAALVFAAPSWADFLLFGAVLLAAIGYAEGGLLARELGAWQTVSWALVVSFPVMLAVTLAAIPDGFPSATPAQWLAFAYLAAVSMFLGFFAWYRGLAIGPMARVSQVQLVQPVLTLIWAAALLGEEISVPTVLGGTAVILCAGLAVRARITR
ncbi:DMT family transporter [Leucobacter luti]|uniref:DMT family transporter n=1 Tax=Leucobacter luti TaxID=340320 RepID=UPI001042960D|nr:DMT family transporter [Leucobacter luti]